MHATVPGLIHGILGGTVLVVVFALAVAYLPLVVAGLISVLTSRQNVAIKLMWIILILAAPLIGSIVWFLAGRDDHRPPRTT
ncbi:MAG: Phospholipase D-nuclease N-terminal [Actinoplanes sp.]|nr:Phospholipase D-nuclease N-terminal [Actinoplanes sp.]